MADKVPDPRSGLDEEGEFVPAFDGQRPPFGPGNSVGVRHGAYAVLQLRPRALELADEIRVALGPTYSTRFELAIAASAAAAAQYEKAMVALLDADDPTDLKHLDERAARWAKLLFSALGQLGLTPLAASKLGLNVALGTDAAGRALARHVEEFYGADGSPS